MGVELGAGSSMGGGEKEEASPLDGGFPAPVEVITSTDSSLECSVAIGFGEKSGASTSASGEEIETEIVVDIVTWPQIEHE